MSIFPQTTPNLIAVQRICHGGAGCLTLLLLVKFASGEALGWYYGFISLAAVYMVFDHGLSGILVNKAAAEIPSALTTSVHSLNAFEKLVFHSLCYASFRVYLKIASIFWITVAPFGLYFFSQVDSPFLTWQIPWVVLVTTFSLNLLLLPFGSLIEGSGAITEVYKVRLVQTILGAFVCWATILSGHLLWATIAMPLVTAIIQLIWLGSRWKEIFNFIFTKPLSELAWQKSMLPFETRVAITFISGYVLNQLITLILFQTHGPTTAGMMAVSLTIVNMVAIISCSAITSVVPRITKKVVLKNWKRVDQLFRKAVFHASVIYFVGATACCAALLLPPFSFISNRVLPIELMALLFIAAFAGQIVTAITLKVRAYLGEPLMPISAASALLLLSYLFLFVKTGGATSATFALLSTQCLFALPLSFFYARKFQRQVRLAVKQKDEALHLSNAILDSEPSNTDVAILMTTFNGARYLEEQLLSIENQTHKGWSLHVSDDGSNDETLTLLKTFVSKHVGRVFIYESTNNLGFVGNFFSLLSNANIRSKYYALSDQDDIWCVNKLTKATNYLNRKSNQLALYCSRTKLVDEAGNFSGYSPSFQKPSSFRNALVQSIAGGNTMAFNHTTKELIAKSITSIKTVPSHDWWLYLLVSGCGGSVEYDREPSILYRQHNRNLVGTNTGARAKLARLVNLRKGYFRQWSQQNTHALEACSALLTEENKNLLQEFNSLRNASLYGRIPHVLKNPFYRQTTLGNLALKLAIIAKKI